MEQRSESMDSEGFVIHTAICENDTLLRKTILDYIILFGREMGIPVNIHQYDRMPINPQTLINVCNYMNLVIINARFDEKGVHLCQELQKRNRILPIILIYDENAIVESGLSLVGTIRIPIDFEMFQTFFYRAIGQMLCMRRSQKRKRVVIESEDGMR